MVQSHVFQRRKSPSNSFIEMKEFRSERSKGEEKNWDTGTRGEEARAKVVADHREDGIR